VLSVKIRNILKRIASVIRMCIFLLIPLMYLSNLLRVLFVLSLLVIMEIMFMVLTMASQTKAQRGGPFGCQRPW
jgi:hypothetical protein